MSIEIKQKGNEWRIVLLNEEWVAESVTQAMKVIEKLMRLKDLVGDPKGRKKEKPLGNPKLGYGKDRLCNKTKKVKKK